MKEAAELLYAFLLGQSEITDTIGAGDACRAFPAIAPIDTPKPFLVYSIGSDTIAKGVRQANALVSVYFDGKSYTEMIAFLDLLQEKLDQDFQAYECGEIETGYSEKYDTMAGHINLNIY